MNGPEKPTAKLESLIDLGDKIIAELKALTTWIPGEEHEPSEVYGVVGDDYGESHPNPDQT